MTNPTGDPPQAEAIDVDRTVRVAWEERTPYARASPSLHSTSHLRVTGIDVAIVREALVRAGYRPEFVRSDSWQESLARLDRGEVDAVMGAFLTDERVAIGIPGQSYRDERLTLFLHEGSHSAEPPVDVADLVTRVLDRRIRLGAPIDFFLGDTLMALKDEHPDLIRVAGSELALADAASEDRIDAFLADWFSGHDAIRSQRIAGDFSATDLVVHEAPVHTLFGRSPNVATMVAAYGRALDEMAADGRLAQLKREFAMPSMLAIALTGSWFDILDAIGTIAFALSGVMIARRERFSIFGAVILSGLPAIGGGALRDVLVARYPLGIFENQRTIWLLLATVAVAYLLGLLHDLLARRRRPFEPERLARGGITMIEVCDAIGLASFTITGVFVAMLFRDEPLVVWGPFLGVLTAAGGGVLRDVVREGRGQPTLTRSLYAELSVLGGIVLVLWSQSMMPQDTDPASIRFMVLTVMIGIFVTRLLVVRLGIRSPLFSPLLPTPAPG